jgi:hypothetical protein
VTSASKGAYATATATGWKFQLLARTGPSMGKVAVVVGGKTVASVDLYSATAHNRQAFTVYTTKYDAARSLRFVVLGTKNAKSHGTTVDLDGLVAQQ